MPLTRSATVATADNMNEVELGRDVPDARLMVTIDSAGRQFGDSSPVPIHSCINIATQTGDDEDENGRGGIMACFGGVVKKAVLQRLAYVAIGLLVVVIIILIERLTGTNIIDERKLIQDIAEEIVPKVAMRAATTPSVPSATETAAD